MTTETTYRRDFYTTGENIKQCKCAKNLVTFPYKVKCTYTFEARKSISVFINLKSHPLKDVHTAEA